MELILIRHGLPLRRENPDGVPADPPLSETGHEQARAVAGWLGTDGPIHRIYASPMLRAQQTAEPLAEALGMEIETEPRVSEYDRESSSYVPIEELKRTDYEAWREFMRRGYPPGMDLTDFYRAVVEGMGDIVAGNKGRRVAVFCHGGVINAWASKVMGFAFRLFFHPMYTSVNRFHSASEGVESVGSLNETAHLRGLDG